MALVLPKVLSKKDFEQHRKRCTVAPNAHLQGVDRYKYGKPDPPFEIYKLTENGILFPKYYAVKHLKSSYNNVTINNDNNMNIQFSGNLREYQEEAIEKIQKSYNENGGALLCFGCGLGKTVVATYMIHKMKVKTAVIVHKTFFVNQW